MDKTCLEFVKAWDSEYINCHTCRYWDREELTCIDKEEIAARNKVRAFDAIEKLMVTSRTVVGMV